MNWRKTKSIFIVCFLLLDAFLVFELYQRQDNESIGGLAEGQTTDVLQNHSVKLNTTVPATPQNVTFLRGRRADLSPEKNALVLLMKPQGGLPKQTITVESNGLALHSIFDKPIAISTEKPEQLKNLLTRIYNGDQYQYWQTDVQSGTMNFVQTYEGRPVFVSRRSNIQMLRFMIDNNQVTGYRQSYFIFEKTNKTGVINAESALNNLGARDKLPASRHPEINKLELGYVNLVGDAGSEPLIFVPTWHIVVKYDTGTKEYFVNAVSGAVQKLD
ncbi:hypothetical protein EWI07_11385 [Sporolactobacillus sp. THM7-4]|nr:hypothetical protein EWI07_11385 [Sporolactobacillus sp. THM7-4]